MSTSSLSPSRSRKPSSTKRVCDYGDAHVSRDKYEDCKEALRDAKRDLEKKENELLSYHNEVADREARLEKAKTQVLELRAKLKEKEEELARCESDYNETLEERDANALAAEAAQEEVRKLQRELRPLKRERSNSPAPDEIKRLKTESQDLRKRLTTLEGAEEKRARLEKELAEARAELARVRQLDATFTPEPVEELQHRLTKAEERYADLELAFEESQRDQEEKGIQLGRALREQNAWKLLAEHWEVDNAEDLDDWIRKLKTAAEENTLDPFRALLPKEFRVAGSGSAHLAASIRDFYTWSFNEVWNLLPVEDGQELVTPSGQTAELGARLASRARKLTRELLRVPQLEQKVTQQLQELEDLRETQRKAWETFCPDPVNIKTPQQLREWIAGLKRQEEHADGLVVANQAVIFEWENNVGIPLLGEVRDLSPQKAGEKLQGLQTRLTDLEDRNVKLRAAGKRLRDTKDCGHQELLSLLLNLTNYTLERWSARKR